MGNTATVTQGEGLGGFIARLQKALADRAAYRRTYRELNALSIDGLLDLDLYRGDLKRIARASVYG